MHWDQNIIFIIIAAIIGISRLVSRISEESKKQSQGRRQPPPQPPQTPQPIRRIQPKTDEERVREFLEALGQPAGAAPPPKAQPRTRASADTIWTQALRSPNAARTAIILREIFGPPRGVQSSNFVFETLTLALIGCLNCILLPAPHGEMRDDSIPPLRGSSVVAIAVIRLLP